LHLSPLASHFIKVALAPGSAKLTAITIFNEAYTFP
jgi:hypothetical protein